jgi:hypothetical protein
VLPASRWRARLRHPIWWLPDIPTEQDEAYRRIWQGLRQHRHVRDGRHDTEAWRSRSGRFALCIVRVPSSALCAPMVALRQTLDEIPFVRLHPDYFLHIPVQELGFVVAKPAARDELSSDRLDEFVHHARDPVAGFRAYPVRLGGINSFLDAPFLDVHDGGWCSRIHHRLRSIVAIPPDNRYPYLPHVTIGHYTARRPIGHLPAMLTPWRDVELGEFTATELEVVTLAVDEPYPPLLTHAVIRFTG